MTASISRWVGSIGKSVMVSGVLTMGASAQQAAVQDLPSAETILDKHVEATGGKQAHLTLTTRKMTGTLAVDMAGHVFEAKVVKHLQAPNNSHLLLEGPQFFQIKASNAQDAWEWRPGPSHGEEDSGQDSGNARLLEGAEKARAITESRFHSGTEWRKSFKKVKTTGVADVEGKPAYEVRVTTDSGEQYSRFYDQESGRLVKYERTTTSAHMGKLDMEVFVGEYREFDGVWLPTRTKQVLKSSEFGEGTQIWTYTKIEHGVKIPASMFKVPDELKG